ncbi:CFEM domain-containing protein [Plectosphaerella plurivora]|uniref:CFEM domain-containing protein n=1 Tax=Plectosphaerella plurivora TaxID=936078 RepID=A0A9P9AHW0_9PEZI|nr:CFEM domain-containing protein [Plectosphaerella plurivora]
MVKGISLFILLASQISTIAAQGELLQYVGRIPQCGISCILQQVPVSACGSLSNTTCICSDQPLRDATQACILKGCESYVDAIDTARVEAEACGRPYRDRRGSLWAPMGVEVVAFISVWLRLYIRWTTLGGFESDDWAILVAVLFYVAESFYLVVLALTKISLLCFFLRVFPNRVFRWATFATIALVSVSTTVLVFLQIFQCVPVRYIWERIKGNFGPHSCLDINKLAYTAAAFSITEDVIILLLPLPSLIRLNVNLRTKIGIILMFSLGILILITSCVRLRSLVLSDALIWTSFEVAISLLVTSLPALRAVLNKFVRDLTEARSNRSKISKRTGETNQSASPRFAAKASGGRDGQISPAGQDSGPQVHQADALSIEENEARFSSDRQPRTAVSWPNLRTIYSMALGKQGQIQTESEEELELGSRTYGNVRTDIWSESSQQGPRR